MGRISMLLAIDGGNSETVFVLYDGRRFRARCRLDLAGLEPRAVTGAAVCCDVPVVREVLRRTCRDFLGVAALMVGDRGVDLGVPRRTDTGSPPGHDRLVNAVAAHRLHRGAVLVVDLGTATTFDVVNADGSLEGGVILPGGEVMRRALARRVALLPDVAPAMPARVIGRDTVSALQSGCYWGAVALIEGLVERLRGAYGRPLTVIATGGLARHFAAGTRVFERVDPDLTLKGLVEIYRRNFGLPKEIK
jgi:type III pantothenate kinase